MKIACQNDLEEFAVNLAGPRRGRQLVKEVAAETCWVAMCVNRDLTIAEMVEKIIVQALSPWFLFSIPASQTPFGVTVSVYRMGQMLIASALAHEIRFTSEAVLPPNPELAKLVRADMEEEVLSERHGIAHVTSKARMSEQMAEVCRWLQGLWSEDKEVHILTSMLGIEAAEGTGGIFVSPITTPETSRLPNDEKRCYLDKFAS